jgi:hypothetical protein
MENFIDKRSAAVGVKTEITEFVMLLLVVLLAAFALPQALLLFGKSSWISVNNQFIVGPIVNCALIFAGVNVRGWGRSLALVSMPSVAAYLGGLILASGSIYALAMIPAVWLGNLAILLSFKYFYINKKWNYALTAAIGTAIKVAFIAGGFYVLKLTLGNLSSPMPASVAEKLGTAMGIYQIYTAAAGAVLAFGIVKFYNKNLTKFTEKT